MPYKRGYKKRRRRAAGTLQRAWRRKFRRKKGSVVVRQTLANKRAIKVLKKAPEIKRSDSYRATPSTNFCGQILSQTKVDNYGLAQSTNIWNTTATGATLPVPELYQPVAMCPLITQQGVQQVSQRIGNDVKMKSLICKVRVYGGDADLNSGRWDNVPVMQKVRMMVLLDTKPVPANTTLNTPTPAWQYSAMGFQFFRYGNTWNPLLPAGTSISQNPGLNESLYDIAVPTANPPGLSTDAVGLMQRFLPAQAFRSEEELDAKRFKVLKVKDFSVSQMGVVSPTATDIDNRPLNSVKTHTYVNKSPYKFTYAGSKSVLPDNHRIYICFFSDCPTRRGTTTAPVTDYLDPPSVSVSARFNYTDS